MRKAKSILIPLVVLCLAGCGRPRGILEREEMVDVLVDMYRTSGTLYALHLQGSDPAACDTVYATLFRDHGITQAEFDSSMAYYNARANIFERIYLELDRRLTEDLQHAQRAAEWARAEQTCHFIGWSQMESRPAAYQFNNYHETLPEPQTLLPDPRTFRYGY